MKVSIGNFHGSDRFLSSTIFQVESILLYLIEDYNKESSVLHVRKHSYSSSHLKNLDHLYYLILKKEPNEEFQSFLWYAKN